ncbi:hypothetical protein CH330_09365 [candidate division WOR-3 bacterium JGI_Cruoil_03_51_56]|uniref:Metal-binding protein n=1 Tax=candidate division WOR-3 bacterium JGI_Cruoil_03_51_56 TaxID=1973747 RepID=A0A235BPK2_UNCW3|nr:MAG: hypothetical protein CH330_09365 [candidate division WOR-3 bacterium JGI_Cruoil_03_51_56]
MNCAECPDKKCYQGKDCFGLRDEVLKAYQDPETLKMTKIATGLEGNYYMKLTRLQELIRFAKAMGYEHLGIAFCIGFSDEARVLNAILKQRFKVSSVCCKTCGIEKEKLGLDKIIPDRVEAMCNPIAQATVLNRARTQLNIILGLCIGHDIIFTKNSKVPVTTLVVKDRVLAHNPVGALYSRYWRNKISAELEKEDD